MTGLILQQFLPYRLSVATNLVSDVIASSYRQLFGLSIPEWRLVAVLAEEPELNQQAISEITKMDKLTVSRAAASLMKRSLVIREISAIDRRSKLLALTPDGRRLYESVVPKALELERAIFADFSAAEKAHLEKTLRRIETAALAANRKG